MSSKYRTSHTTDPNFVFPFVVTAHRQDQIFVDPIWGIKIERILLGRSPIPPEDFRGRLDDVNYKKIPIGPDPFIYLVRRSSLIFAKTFDQNDYHLERYNVPPNAPSLVFEYRLRESNDSLGPVLTLESVLV